MGMLGDAAGVAASANPFVSAAMLIPQAAQMGYGMWQYGQGRKLSRTAVPDYNIPDEYGQMMDLQRTSMLGDMPGSNRIKQDIRGNTSDRIDTAARYGTMNPNTVNAAYNKEQEGMANLGVQNAMFRTGEKDKFANALNMNAQQELQKQNWETLQPYERTMQTASAMMGAGTQNMFGGMQGATDYLGNKDMMRRTGY